MSILDDARRENDQLLQGAIYYLSLAKDLLKYGKLNSEMTINQIAEGHEDGNFSDSEKLLAHLSSSAFRLHKLWEKYKNLSPPLGLQDYRISSKKANDRKELNEVIATILLNKEDYILGLLRDTVAHPEDSAKNPWEENLQKIRKPVLSNVSVKEALDHLELACDKVKEWLFT